MTDEVIQPLGKVFIQIRCTNPACRKEFSVELKNDEGLVRCSHCQKKYYVRIGAQVWVKSING